MCTGGSIMICQTIPVTYHLNLSGPQIEFTESLQQKSMQAQFLIDIYKV